MAYSTWGGRRPGSGRKPTEGEALTKTVVVRVTGDQRELFLECGGAPWLRRALAALKKARGAQDDAKLTFEHYRAVADKEPDRNIRLMLSTVECGYPSPASDYTSEELNLNDYLVPRPESTILVEAKGDSMVRAGSQEGDILVIDRSVLPRDHDIAVVMINHEFTAKRLRLVEGRIELHPESDNQTYKVLIPEVEDEVEYVGVVTSVIHRIRRS